MGQTHRWIGVCAGLGAGFIAPTLPAALLCGLIGSLTALGPDLDTRGKASRALGPIGWLLTKVLRVSSAWLAKEKHRGFTHSLLFVALTAALVWVGATRAGAREVAIAVAAVADLHIAVDTRFDARSVTLAALAGGVSHLAADAITPAGLRWIFWPARIRIGLPPALTVTTGGRLEGTIRRTAIALAAALTAELCGIPVFDTTVAAIDHLHTLIRRTL